jgi:integrase
MRLDDVSEADVRRGLAGLRKKNGQPLSAQTLSNALTLLRGALEGARREEHISVNPAEKVRLPKGAHARTDRGSGWLRAEEIARLLDDRELSLAQRSMIVVAIYAGLRSGELCALRWQDVDLERRVLHVCLSRRGPRKNGRVYDAPLLAPAWDMLGAWQAEFRGLNLHSSKGLVWPARSGDMHTLGYDAGTRWRTRTHACSAPHPFSRPQAHVRVASSAGHVGADTRVCPCIRNLIPYACPCPCPYATHCRKLLAANAV